MQLVIVESPTKSRTITRFLGPQYKVLSSYGHIRDLPQGKLGIDIENNFQPNYVIPQKARKTVEYLKKELQKADKVILSTDQDREGEAIAWHLAQTLSLGNSKSETRNSKPYERIVFHEITKSAIEEALKNPRDIDMNLVAAQQARRVLDRIVGYKLSPFLWKKIARGLSAGRVQSVAVRLICEREEEIKNFNPQEFWQITAHLTNKEQFKALLKSAVRNKEEADKILKDLEGATYTVSNVEKKEIKRNPLPPFTTSTLQQESWQRFKFPAKRTMRLAQHLYEKGLITYHRSDSLNLSDFSLAAAKKFITQNYREHYHQFRKYKTKSKGAQEAHEAIRPTYPNKTPDNAKLEGAYLKLYQLIWQRFIACQMSQAVFDSTTIDVEAKNYEFRATGQVLKFDGFLKVYPMKFAETELPPLKKGENLKLTKLEPSQHFTQPPSRYTEATLIKLLEQYGIGRPSTYAPVLSTIQERNYIEKDQNKKFCPTEMGATVNSLLVKHFPRIVDIKFTAGMEENLDKIAQGEKKWEPVIKEFYEPFAENLQEKYEEVSKKEFTELPTERKCPKCGSPLVIRLGKFGKFYACSNFPKCRHTEPLKENTLGIKCPKCKKGEIVQKRTKKNKIFYGCNQYPSCDFAAWDFPTGELCPKCQSPLVKTKRGQVKCSNKECSYNKEKNN